MRLLVHAGFHKTGTSSIQQTLDANRDTLAPAARIVLKDDMKGVTEAARAYSRTLDDVEWALFLHEARLWFATLDSGDARPVLVSSEDLSGHMPFRHGLSDYGAAPRLVSGLADALRAVHPDAAPEFLFTTRAPVPWVKSCWAQHVRAVRFTDSLEAYTERALPHADLNAMTDRIATAVAPLPVHRAALEDIGAGPLGPVDALLDLAGIDPGLRRRLRPLPPANTAMPAEVLEALLSLNRSGRDWTDVREEKKRLIRRARRAAA